MWIEGVGEGDNGYAWRPQQGGPACFAKVDQAKTTRRDCLGLWLALKASPSSWAARNRGTLSIHILCPTSPPRAFPWNVSIVLPFRLTSGLGTLLLIRPSSEADSIPGSVLPNPGRIFYVQIFAVLALATTLSLHSSEERVISCSGESCVAIHLSGHLHRLLRLLLHLLLRLLLLL